MAGIHPHTLTDMHDKFWGLINDLVLDRSDALRLFAFLTADLVNSADGKPSIRGLAGYRQLSVLVRERKNHHNLTDAETLNVLVAFQQRLTTHMLRDQRHPNNPHRKADEA